MSGQSTEVEQLEGDAPEKSGMESLAELLAAEEQTEESEQGEADGNVEDKAKPSKFNDLAEATGLDLDALYALEVSTNDGEPLTVQDLKNAYTRQDDLTLKELEFEETKAKSEAELRRAQNELNELMAALPQNAVKPEVLERIRAKHSAHVEGERAKTLEAIPEWKDDGRRADDIKGMSDHLADYGFPVDYLKHVVDHRQMKYIRDSYLREQRIRKALEKVKAGKPVKTTPVKPTGKPPTKRPVSSVNTPKGRNTLETLFSNLE